MHITAEEANYVKPLTQTEQDAALRWHGDKPLAALIALKVRRRGRFCVVQGDYSKRNTADLESTLRDLINMGRHNSPSARYIKKELFARHRGAMGFAPVDPNGPRAA